MVRSNPDDFDGYRKWLGISDKKRPPSHYELLGISLDEDDTDVIKSAVEQRRQYVESKRGDGHDGTVTEILYRISEAEATLLNDEMRRDYDRKLDLFQKRRKDRQVDPIAPRSRVKSRPGKTVGEDTGIVKTFAGIMVVIVIAFGCMAWFSFQMPWSKPFQKVEVQPAPPAQQPQPAQQVPQVEPALPAQPKLPGVVQPPVQQPGQAPPVVAPVEPEPVKAVEPVQPKDPSDNRVPQPVLQLTFDANQTPGVQLKLRGALYRTGKVGKALQFDGRSFASVNANLPIGNAPRSLAVWLKDTRGPLQKRLIHPVTQGHLAGTAFGIMQASGKWRFFDFKGGLDSGHQVDREWHHHCVTSDGTTITYYYDGNKAAEVKRVLNTARAPLMLGTYGDDLEPEKRFVGLIDELKIFRVSLSPEQVRQVMADTK